MDRRGQICRTPHLRKRRSWFRHAQTGLPYRSVDRPVCRMAEFAGLHEEIMQDKVVVVSGGSSGIGAEISMRLSSEGARVVIADLNVSQAEAIAESIAHQSG